MMFESDIKCILYTCNLRCIYVYLNQHNAYSLRSYCTTFLSFVFVLLLKKVEFTSKTSVAWVPCIYTKNGVW